MPARLCLACATPTRSGWWRWAGRSWASSAARWDASPFCGAKASWATPCPTLRCRGWPWAFLLAGRDLGALLVGAGIGSWLALRFSAAVLSTTRIKQDAALGIVLASWFAAGIALLTYIQSIPDASQAGLDHFIFGQAAAIIESDVELISSVGAVVLLALALFWKEFKLVTFDPEFAGANGFRTGLINTLLSTLVVVAIVLGLQLAGVILMVGMLIAPAIAARQWTRKLEQMVILAGVLGGFAGGSGAVISAFDGDIPTGPTIIVVAFVLVLISILLAPDRGLVPRRWRQHLDGRRFAVQNMLQDLYRYASAHGGADAPVPDEFVRGISGKSAARALHKLQRDGQAEFESGAWQLTARGIELAMGAQRNLRLWEMYRLYADELNLPALQEERQQDIRLHLSADAIAKLEAMLEGQRP